MDLGLLIVRIVVGASLALQGVAKLRRDGRSGTAAFFESEGFLPARTNALLAGSLELGAGLLLLVGLGTPLASAAVIGVMINAIAVSGRHGWSAVAGGAEYPTVIAAVVRERSKLQPAVLAPELERVA